MRASTSLGMSVEESQLNLKLLRNAKMKLNADLKDKRAATAVSKNINLVNDLNFDQKLKFGSKIEIFLKIEIWSKIEI